MRYLQKIRENLSRIGVKSFMNLKEILMNSYIMLLCKIILTRAFKKIKYHRVFKKNKNHRVFKKNKNLRALS